MGLMDLLNQVVAGGHASEQHFDQVAQTAPPNVLADGLAHAFNSDQTPAIGQMVAQLFERSTPEQQAGMLNALASALGPGAGAALGGGALAGVLAKGSAITPEQAGALSPQQVEAAVQQAHGADPGIADTLAGFYAQHSGLIKTLGGAALAIAMVKMKSRMEG